MKTRALVGLIAAIILIGLFLVSWLVFKNIKTSDWIMLFVGIVNLYIFADALKRLKK